MTRTLPVLVALCTAAAASGCVPWYSDPVNGEDDNFVFSGPFHTAVGEPLTMYVFHDQAALQGCGKGCSDVAGGDDTGFAEILTAKCEGDACTVVETRLDGGALSITVTSTTPIRTRLEVRARLTDGRELTDHKTIGFDVPDRVMAYCDQRGFVAQACGGRFGLLPGARVSWQVRPEHLEGGGAIGLSTAKLDVTIDGDALALDEAPKPPTFHDADDPASPSWSVYLSAKHPGKAVVHLRTAGLTRDVEVRVGDPADVVALELRGVVATRDPRWVAVEEDPTVAPVTRLAFTEEAGYYVIATLADGTQVMGGASALHRESAPAPVLDPIKDADAFGAAIYRLYPAMVGPERVIGTLGRASLSFPVEIVQE